MRRTIPNPVIAVAAEVLWKIGFNANRRLLSAQSLSHDCLIGERRFRSVSEPIVVKNQRASGLRFGDRRVLALMHALSLFTLDPAGLRHRLLREKVAQLLGLPHDSYSSNQMTHDLRRLRLHGLIQRVLHSHRYRLTRQGATTALFYVRFYARAPRPGMSLNIPSPTNRRTRTALGYVEQAIAKLLEEVHLAA